LSPSSQSQNHIADTRVDLDVPVQDYDQIYVDRVRIDQAARRAPSAAAKTSLTECFYRDDPTAILLRDESSVRMFSLALVSK